MLNDKQLQQAVRDEIAWCQALTSADIGVTARNGVVTLSGHVPAFWQKLEAEKAVQRVKGVKGLAEELRVQLSDDAELTDEEIAERAVFILASDVCVPNASVRVKVEKGLVTLTGELDWNYQKTEAEFCVRKIAGIVGIKNEISLKPHVRSSDVRGKIVDALDRIAPFDAEALEIEANGGVVSISGDVGNWYERELVVDAAWSAPGVTKVDARLTVDWPRLGTSRSPIA